ncbi:hypothetical protein Tco_0397598 [Tanacetum coccineum]
MFNSYDVIQLSLNPIYAIKECSTCGALYTADFCCSKKGLEDKILVPNPESSQRPIIIEKICFNCGDLVRGLYCRKCALIRKTLEEVFQNLQDTSGSSDDNTNVVNAPREPIVVNQDPDENSSPSPPHIDHCCHECGDSLDGIFCRQCTCKFCAKIPICYDDDEDDTIAITPVLPIEEPDNSLSMGDEHLDTIPETESDKFIKSSVEILVQIPSESEGIPDKMCDVPLCENTTPLNAFNEHSEIVFNSNDDNSSSDDDSTYGEDIDYVDASPPDVEIVSLEVVEIVVPEVGRIDDDILLTIKDDILREKLLNVNLLIAKIDALRDNPTPSSNVLTKSTATFSNLFLEETNTFDNSIPESETFRFNLEEISSGSPTTHSELSLLDYKAFYVDNDHFKEKSNGSTTTHVDFSRYDSFIFDLSNDQFPPADRSDLYHEEFADELTHIMSLPNLECFKFKIEPDPGDLTSIDPGIRKNVSTTNVNVPLEDDQSSLLAYVVWIFLTFLIYPVVPPYLLSTGNEDTIFDPGISIYHSFMPDVSHRNRTFMKFNDCPDCEDYRALSFVFFQQSFTSSASFWESSI